MAIKRSVELPWSVDESFNFEHFRWLDDESVSPNGGAVVPATHSHWSAEAFGSHVNVPIEVNAGPACSNSGQFVGSDRFEMVHQDAGGDQFAALSAATLDLKAAGGGGKPGGGGSGGGSSGTLLTTYTSGDAGVSDADEFNIRINFSGTWTAKQQAVVTWAAEFLSDLIIADARNDTDLAGNAVDDIVISMSTGRIDGSGNPLLGNTLAQTQITAVRDAGSIDEWQPVTASIKLDSTDLKNSVSGGWSGAWDGIILHEMIHALGFAGVVFDGLGLIDDAGNFTGFHAVAAYGGPVPIEGDGGTGTVGSHWDEATFAPGGAAMPQELMTGWVPSDQPTQLSDTTLGALADLGYEVRDLSSGNYLVVDSGLLLV